MSTVQDYTYMLSFKSTCRICDKKYSNYVKLRQHFNRRHATEEGMSTRKLRVDYEKPYNCSQCYNGYMTIQSLRTHFLDSHKDAQTAHLQKEDSDSNGKDVDEGEVVNPEAEKEAEEDITIHVEDNGQEIADNDKDNDTDQHDENGAGPSNTAGDKMRLPEGYGLPIVVLFTLKKMISAVDPELAEDFGELRNKALDD